MVKSLEKNSTRIMYDTNLQGNSNDELGAVPPLEEVSKGALSLEPHGWPLPTPRTLVRHYQSHVSF